ncbi:MAG: molybdopterin-dependent oxidoreductase, partial [Actinomycetota bacterium]
MVSVAQIFKQIKIADNFCKYARPGTEEKATHVSVGDGYAYTANLPLEVLLDEDVMVAWAHNGKDLAPKHGFPLRLVVPKFY